MRVEQVMTRAVLVAAPATPLREVARLLADHRVSGLPVVDEEGAVVGVVSGSDLLAREAGDGRAEARTAREAMTAPAVCVAPAQPTWEAAALMTGRRVDRLPVVAADGALVGIVTRADLVRAFARPDEEVELELREELARDGIDVEVTCGEATLRGVVVTRRQAADVVLRARRVPGVVGVAARLLLPGRPLVPRR